MIAQLQENSWSKLLTFVLPSKLTGSMVTMAHRNLGAREVGHFSRNSHYKTFGSDIHLAFSFAACSSFFTAAMVRAV